ncbi:MAG: hypothetical protein IPJ64_07955 [Saprospiraceae bacterium]|nr:hypothetical protein [Saprospiraceae bacterium]MBK7796285.1 hypothetical protein [Saprospiraceae bacterium]
MKYRLLLLFVLIGSLTVSAQFDNPLYDPLLAESLGGDDYGMKSYMLVILKTGTAEIEDKQIRDNLFQGHIANIVRLAKEGKLVVAGPLSKNDKNYRGIFILNSTTKEEAEILLQSDPAIKEKVFETEIYKWYGSAALPTYLPNHEKIEKKKM